MHRGRDLLVLDQLLHRVVNVQVDDVSKAIQIDPVWLALSLSDSENRAICASNLILDPCIIVAALNTTILTYWDAIVGVELR